MLVYSLKTDPTTKKYTTENGVLRGWDNGPVDAPDTAWEFLGTRDQVDNSARRLDKKAYDFWIKRGESVEEATRRSTRVV